jgi:NAD(P)-dependent dehydrogenase (short-subunit alcohol dehydrogenase family)
MTSNPTIDLSGLRCVVTGAASGIGASVVQHLRSCGAELVTIDRNPLPEHVAAASDRHLLCDLTDPAALHAVAAEIDGTMDALVNVAGLPGTATPDAVVAVNFLALRQLTEALADRIDDGGAIVNIASIAGSGWRASLQDLARLLATTTYEEGSSVVAQLGMDGSRAYNFSKEAVIVWTMANCLRWWGRGVRLNCISPGTVDTPILNEFRESMGHQQVANAIGLVGRVGAPSDIAPVVAFAVSKVAPWINGANLVVDGGLLGTAEGSILRTMADS